MTKLELGTKRICSNCNVKFYDLHKTRVVCPKCDTVFVPPPVKAERPGRAVRPVSADVAAPSDARPKPAPLNEATEGSDQAAVEEQTELKDESDGFAMLEREDEEDDATGADDDSIEKTDEI